MKKSVLQTILFAIFMIFGYSCNSEGEFIGDLLTISEDYMHTSVVGEEKTITVEASGSWTATSSKSWLSVTPSSGEAGKTDVKIKVKEFSNDDAHKGRSGYVTFKLNDLQAKFEVEQEWSYFFTLPCTEYAIDHNGGNITIGGLSKSGFSITTSVSGQGWVRPVGNVLEISYNSGEIARSTTLTIVDNKAGKTYQVFLLQQASNGDSNVLPLTELKIDGYICPSDIFTDQPDFMYSVDADVNNSGKSVKIEFKGNGVQWITIGDNAQKVYSGDTVSIPEMKPGTALKIHTHSQTTSRVGVNDLNITSLPIMTIKTSETIKDEPKVDCSIQLFDPKGRTDDGDRRNLVLFESKAAIEYRGAGAMRYPKKPYNFKLKTDTGEKREAELLNIRNDNSWILDAMYLDMARMRNRVCFDMWNTFNKPYYVDEKPKASSGTHGDYVEVFINSEYMGLFILSDRIDRKQYQIDQDGGYIYKAKGWTAACYLQGYSARSSNDDYYWNSGEIEQEYPDADDGKKPNFNHMADFIDFVSKTSKSDFSKNFSNRIAENSVIDTFIFLNLILGYDNAGRNTYWVYRNINTDKRIMHGLWDLDGTLGRDWNRVTTSASAGWYYGNSANPGSSHFKLFKRIIDGDVEGLQQKIYDRWMELKDNQLAPENFEALVDSYANKQISSGARDREVARWRKLETQDAINGTNGWVHYSGNYGDVEGEVKYMKQWYRDRMKKLDSLISTFNGK